MPAYNDYREAQELFYNVTILTAEEAHLIQTVMPEEAKKYLFYHSWNNTYLNLNVYSEVDKENHDLRKELGF